MNLSQTTTSEQTDKRYTYRYYSRTLIIVLLLVNGIVTLVFAWLAITNRQVVNWFGFFVFFASFLFSGRIAFLDARNKFSIMVSQTGIHLPAIWKRGATDYLPFSSISAMELIKLRKDTILKLSAGKEIHVVSEAFFPERRDFRELIGIIQKQSPVPFSGGAL